MKRVVVFDTGAGGRIFAEHFRRELLNVLVVEAIDSAHAPYGERSAEEIVELTSAALADYLGTDALIVLACNTATAYAADSLRAKYPEQDFVGVEPGIKPAAELARDGKVLMLATPATLRSARYRRLLARYAGEAKVLEADCADWARKIDGGNLSEQEIRADLAPFVREGVDVVVLGCTHYLAIPQEMLEDIFPGALIYSPLAAVTERVRELLRRR